MGNYDSQYEATAREDAERTLAAARRSARTLRLPLLADSEFKAIGVCQSCANTVYVLPNWACRRTNCPHKP